MSGSYQTNDPLLATWGVLLIIAVGIVIVGIGGIVYFFLFPEIQNQTQATQTISDIHTSQNSSSYDSVLKTLNDDERKVLNTLKKHNGKYLQKYIRHETGLSRLKTHRIVARFAERGIVTLEKTGNTNEVTLAEWLR